MLARLRSHLTYANVTATLALFLALGGGIAWALETNSVKSKHIVNEQVKAVDIQNADPEDLDANQIDGVNAAMLGGQAADQYAVSEVPVSAGANFRMRYHAAFINTALTGDSVTFGAFFSVTNFGTPDKFRVCNQSGNPMPAAITLGGVHSQITVPASGCSGDLTIPDDGDFTISANRVQVFGVFSGNVEDGYMLFGLLPG